MWHRACRAIYGTVRSRTAKGQELRGQHVRIAAQSGLQWISDEMPPYILASIGYVDLDIKVGQDELLELRKNTILNLNQPTSD